MNALTKIARLALVVGLAASLGAAPQAAKAAPSSVFLGTNTTLFGPYSFCNSGIAEGGTPWLRGAVAACSQQGFIWTYALATAQTFLGSDAHAWGWVQHSFNVAQRCTGQVPSLPGKIVANYSYNGRLFAGLGSDEAKYRVWFSPDGSAGREFQDFQDSEGFGDRHPSGLRSTPNDGRASVTGRLGDTLSPYLKAQSDASALGIGVTAAESDFYDGDRGTQVQSMVVTWDDNSAPITSHSVSSAQQSIDGWRSSPATVTIRSRDTESCTRVISAFDGNSWDSYPSDFNESDRDVQVSGTGTKTVMYNATNYNDDVSATTTLTVRVDGTAPETDHVTDCTRNGDGDCENRATVRFQCSDAHSGCGATRFRVDGGAWQTGDSVTITELGDHQVEYFSIDQVGNQEGTESMSLRIVCGGPLGFIHDLTGICVPL